MLNHFLTFTYNIAFHILLIHRNNPRQFISCLTAQCLCGSVIATPCHWHQLTKKRFERRQNGSLEVVVPMLSFCYKHPLKFLWLANCNSYHGRSSAILFQPFSISLLLLCAGILLMALLFKYCSKAKQSRQMQNWSAIIGEVCKKRNRQQSITQG